MICLPVTLVSLLMCPTEVLHAQPGWGDSVSSSRERLLGELSSKLDLANDGGVAGLLIQPQNPFLLP